MRKFECDNCTNQHCYAENIQGEKPSKCLFDIYWDVDWREVKVESKLPKLTAEALKERGIEWPVWAKIAVVNADGSGAFGKDAKSAIEVNNGGSFSGSRDALWADIPGKWDNSDWENSLIERPAVVKQNLTTELPEWCKVGEWVYETTRKQFHRIKTIGKMFDGRPSVEWDDRGDGYIGSCTIEHLKRAKLRMWNKSEMRQQVGRTFILDDGKTHALCIAATDRELFFLDTGAFDNEDDTMRCISYSSDTIRYRNTFADGTPCGVLEVVAE